MIRVEVFHVVFRISYSIVSYLLYALVDQITSVAEERTNFSAIGYL